MAIIYCAENLINGKKYVGKTLVTLEHRWYNHRADARRGSKLAFHNAIRKYGPENFNLSIIVECDSNEEACRLEKQAILDFSTHISTGKGYNITWGGDGMGLGEKHPCFGTKRTPEVKALLSESKLGEKNPSFKASGEGHWNRGLVRSAETRRKISEKRALQDMSHNRKNVCSRGHLRSLDNVTSNGTCKMCKEISRKKCSVRGLSFKIKVIYNRDMSSQKAES